MLKVALFILTFSLFNNAQAAFTKGDLCGGLFLKILKDKNQDVSGLDESTQRAYQSLKKFRKSLFGSDSTQWSFEDILTHSEKASRSEMTRVAQRIRGIEKTHEENVINPGGMTKYSLTGTQFRGSKDIGMFFLNMELEANKMLRARESYLETITQRDHKTANAFLLMSAFNPVAEYFLQMPGVFTFLSQTVLTSAWAYLKWGKPFHPLIQSKIKKAELFNKKFEEFKFFAMSAAKSAAPAAWVFWGESATLYTELSNAINKGSDPKSQLAAQSTRGTQAHLEIPESKSHEELTKLYPVSQVQLDFLLHFEDQEPVLDVFMRLNTPRELPGPGRPIDEIETQYDLSPALQLIPVRTN